MQNTGQIRDRCHIVLGVLAAAALTACGGGGSDSGGNGNGAMFDNAAVQAGSEPKTLEFTWSFSDSADHFELEVNPDGASGYTQADINGDGTIDSSDDIAASASSATLPIPLHLAHLDDAMYRVAAFDANGNEIAASDDLALMNVAINSLIGYFKASNTDGGDEFSTAVALSGSGETLAVSAPLGDGAASGIGGDQSDNSAGDAGAGYLY